jgi:TRAP transporter TAXI family solute receptor
MRLIINSVVRAAGAAVVLVGTSAASAQTIGFATGPQATPTNATGAAVAKVVNEAVGLQTRAVPYTSNEISLTPLNRDQMQFAVTNADVASAAVRGVEVFDGRKHENIRVALRLMPLNLGVVVRKDSPIRTMADLKGRCYPSAFTAQLGQVKVATSLLANAGLTYKDVRPNPIPNTSRSAEDFAQGKCDSAMMALGGARLRQIDAQVGGIRVLPIDSSEAGINRIREFVPLAFPYELKAGSLPGVDQTTTIMSYDILLLTNAQVSDDVVYKTLKAMHEGKDKLVAVTPVMRDFEPKLMYREYPGLEFHPAALRFYKEVGLFKGK